MSPLATRESLGLNPGAGKRYCRLRSWSMWPWEGTGGLCSQKCNLSATVPLVVSLRLTLASFAVNFISQYRIGTLSIVAQGISITRNPWAWKNYGLCLESNQGFNERQRVFKCSSSCEWFGHFFVRDFSIILAAGSISASSGFSRRSFRVFVVVILFGSGFELHTVVVELNQVLELLRTSVIQAFGYNM